MRAIFSSKESRWATPQDLFDELNAEFQFTLDPCADETNHKCEKWYGETEDGLARDWGGETVFCNPPYGRQLKRWVEKAYCEAMRPGTTVVMLIPARTDTEWFHSYVLGHEIRFIRGRLKFGEGKNHAPFASMVVVMRGREKR